MTAKNKTKNNGQVHDTSPTEKKKKKSDAIVTFLCAVFYVTLAAAAAIASLYIQQALSDVTHLQRRHDVTTQDIQHTLQQISSVKESLEGLESLVVGVKADVQSSSRAVQRGEAENRRLEETLQNLQKKIFTDLTNSVQELKDTREQDISSLERTLKERLAELTRSVAESLAEFSVEQSQYKNELQLITSHLEEHETPALLKQELMSIQSAVANLNTASEVSEGNVEVLREQIAAVSAELQTRNKEVASVSEEINSMRSLVKSTMGAFREEVSTARTGAQAASDTVQALSEVLERSDEALQTLETQLREDLLNVERRGEDVEARLKATGDSQELLMSSLMEQTNKLQALTSKFASQESLMKNYRIDLEEMKKSLNEIQTSVTALDETRVRLEVLELKLDGPVHDVETTVDGPSEETDE